jgi:hypothetical protein
VQNADGMSGSIPSKKHTPSDQFMFLVNLAESFDRDPI